MTAATMALWLAMTPAPQYIAVPLWPASMEPIVSYWSDTFLVPRWLGWKTMMVESGGNPKATGNEWEKVKSRGKVTWVRGKVLAEGAFMISVKHRDEHLSRAGVTRFDSWNVSDSARVGLCYMGSLIVYFKGDLRPVTAAYNAGRNRAAQWYYDGRALPRETAEYLIKVLGRR